MAAAITNPLALSKERLADLQENLTGRAEKLLHQATQRLELTTGAAKESGLGLAYGAGAAALDSIANATALLPFGAAITDELTKRAATLSEAGAVLALPPVDGYDGLNVKEVGEAIEALDTWGLQKVRRYEVAHKNRKTVLAAVERRLG